ncbi:segregation/condensation protein A [Paenalkalicoccus suaedae]|uniref:Segregation and condensation protein A n=1 Tax=Paenalkalicoccus suaedae TaxID=2592382 RepID=A0A859FDX4_9BACI|nr:segregation/condensation protein A [Paenalkalicoccus suaedae]QKS71038.1 segregation/condensation protein A [Paenalkalicoccus suaedae]
MTYNVKLHSFEGPLDLLLHLIQQNDLDLYDIPVREITEQYLAYIHAMKVLQLDIASEYLVMAATLLHMKSKLLLPVEEEEWEEEWTIEEEELTKDSLMQRLIEYKRYKEAASDLKEREIARSDLFSKPMTDLTPLLVEEKEQENAKMNVTVYDMLQAFQLIQKRRKKPRPMTTVTREEIPIDTRMVQVVDILKRSGGRTTFHSLFDDNEDAEIVVTFLAILELMKEKEIACEQSSNFDEITIEWKGDYDKLG